METQEPQTTLTQKIEQPVSENTEPQNGQVKEPVKNELPVQEQEQKQVQKLVEELSIEENFHQFEQVKQTQQVKQHQSSQEQQQHSQEQAQNNKIQNEKRQVAFRQQEHLKQDTMESTYDHINISKQNIQFGKFVLYPGSIEQVDLTIDLKSQLAQISQTSNNPFMLRVIAKCSNQQFNDLDQYVFSVRSNERYQYFEQVRFKIKALQRAQVKIAVKIPQVKKSYAISGVLEVQLENLKPFCLPIKANCQVPSVVCLKNLFKTDENEYIIKFLEKKIKQECHQSLLKIQPTTILQWKFRQLATKTLLKDHMTLQCKILQIAKQILNFSLIFNLRRI